MRQRSLEDAVFVVVRIIRFISGVAVCGLVKMPASNKLNRLQLF